MRSVTSALLNLAIGILLSLIVVPCPANASSITFYVVDAYGQRLPYSVRSFVNVLNPDRDITSRFKGMRLDGVVPGGYKYILKPVGQTGYDIITGTITFHGGISG